jgi:DNA-binding NarL/FixJ family response regulator
MPSSVVIADDDLDYRDFVRSLIASPSDTMTVVGDAADGEAALTVVLRERPDIVITDLLMPRLNGIEPAKREMFVDNIWRISNMVSPPAAAPLLGPIPVT